ncbi:MAG: hypothetical protein H7Y01_06335 [Ferruginibacter sp.]|nr:hypothetical protein [Chitinophagaceae bacterium]
MVTAILVTGLVAGTLDGLAAILNFTIQGNKHPERIFKYIASAAFGAKATTGGEIMIAWGVFFHYLIAFAFTIFFFIIFPRVKWLQENVLLGGLLYGLFVWLVMNRVVVPLSQLPPSPFKLKSAIINMLILMVCIGLPVAVMANKHYLYKK